MQSEDIDTLAAAYGYTPADQIVDPDAEYNNRRLGGWNAVLPTGGEPVTDSRSEVELDKLRLLDELKRRRQRLDVQSKELGSQIAELERDLVEQMMLSGQVSKLPVDDRAATVRTDVWGKRLEEVTDEEYYAAFEAAGPEWADLVKPGVHAKRLQSKLNELEAQHAEEYGDSSPGLPDILPESLRAVMTTTEKYSITFSNIAPTRATQRAKRR